MDIRPFAGWRYRPQDGGDISPFLAPPYDVLTVQDKRDLQARSDRNIVSVDLPHVPPKEVGPDQAYQQAGELLARWMSDGTLVRDDKPCLYVYEQTYQWAGRQYVRTALLAGVRATPFGQDVIPHEKTFAGPKADRLKLTQRTRMQLSPIFGFFRDSPGQEIHCTLRSLAQGQPDAWGEIRGVGEKLWVIDGSPRIEHIRGLLAEKKVYIADGHHRYTTALNYRDLLQAEGTLDPEHPANFVQFALVSRDDPGMRILPTHRVIRGLAEDFSIDKLIQAATEFAWETRPCVPTDLSDADALLAPHGDAAMALLGGDGQELHVARLVDPGAMKQAAPDELDAWRELDVAILHKLIIDKALAPWKTERTTIDYTPDGPAVAAAVQSGQAQLGVCLQATKMRSVEAIADAGAVMPHKSTYFYPKLTTGIVLKPLE
ncbi:MAG: hypothetical protein BWX88_02831 [Planctomycetes bacterium ADurb.Bin126]|mgnify:FL=1|nr:MAG: hypothetical protein BWX88_02831 [Planctomycetes bacterium ADurb.Bin126]HQL72542.1 DUF1015 domain-containing protein [Phycisphaerae bacterium]